MKGTATKKPKVLIMMGSDSDLPVMGESAAVLEEFGVSCTLTIASAHRTPDRVRRLVEEGEKQGIEVIISGAGMAAHLPGVIASFTLLPVIGVPLDASSFHGLDSLLSIVQMPPGIPVATMAVGKAGAKNAALLAVRILAMKDAVLSKKLRAHRQRMARDVEEKARKIAART